MAPYLQTVKSFADVPQSDAGVDTVQFLEASRGLVGIFDLLNSAAFTMVTKDLNGNIAKVQTRYDAAPDKSATLEQLVTNEMAEKKTTATQGLLWLLRGLSFTQKALKKSQADSSATLSAAFTDSYGETLKQYHNFVVKGLFTAAMKACPARDTLYTKLKEDRGGGVAAATQEDLDSQLEPWLQALGDIVTKVNTFYTTNGYEKGL